MLALAAQQVTMESNEGIISRRQSEHNCRFIAIENGLQYKHPLIIISSPLVQ